MKTTLPFHDPSLAVYPSTPERGHTDPVLEDEWARQLASMICTQAGLPTAPVGAGSSPAARPQAVRAAIEHNHSAQQVADVGPQNSDAACDKRLTLHVTTAELGEVSIIIDRAAGGVRVVVGVGGHGAEQALEPEKAALIRSLRAIGLDVHSVNVVRQTQVGTVLAQPSSARTNPADPEEGNADPKHSSPRKNPKRIALIG
jgi:flagellar hook-length control protein FliK